jgi:uncharacterized protein
MYRLPLFPLNTVLFPRMPLSLHVFEERYKLMMQRCISERTPFGVVLIESGAEVLGYGTETIPHLIGCTAVINHVQTLPMGRMNLTAIGEQRFTILRLEHDEPYLVGVVENIHLDESDEGIMLRQRSEQIRTWIERYLSVLERTDRVRFDRSQLPASTVDLAYLASAILKISNDEKQLLLAENSLLTLLSTLRRIYGKEVAIMDVILAENEKDEQSPFSVN